MKSVTQTVFVLALVGMFASSGDAQAMGFVEKLVKAPGKLVDDAKEEIVEATTGKEREDLIRNVRRDANAATTELRKQADVVAADIDSAVRRLEKTIDHVKWYGMDPRQVRATDGSFVDLVAQKESLLATKSRVVGDIRASIARISKSEREAIKKINKMYR